MRSVEAPGRIAASQTDWSDAPRAMLRYLSGVTFLSRRTAAGLQVVEVALAAGPASKVA